MFYIHRYLRLELFSTHTWIVSYFLLLNSRLTGMYAFVVLFHMSLLKYMDSGPNSRVPLIRNDCQKSWWRNLLYINNLNYRGHYNVETMDEMVKLEHYFYKIWNFDFVLSSVLVKLGTWAMICKCLLLLHSSFILCGDPELLDCYLLVWSQKKLHIAN